MFRQLNNAKVSKPFSIILGLILLLNLFLPGSTLASTSTTPIPDNFPENRVSDLKNYKEYKIEIQGDKFTDGPYGDGNLSLNVTWGDNGEKVSWSSNIPVAYVFVKGGKGGGGTLYTYEPPVKRDSNLGTGTDQQISHVTFYYNEPIEEPKPGSISGAKYNDLNGNGTWDQGEPGIKDWTIKLYQGGEVKYSTQTDDDGKYSFKDLAAGTYKVYEEQKEGWIQKAPASIFYTIELAAEQNVTDKNFGNMEVKKPEDPKENEKPKDDDKKEGEPTAPPSKDSSPGIKITPERVPAGDPIITLKPTEPLKEAYAILPHGKRIDLHYIPKKGIWKGFFLVPFGTPDGPYLVKIYTKNRQNVTRQYNYTITIDNSIPLVTIKNVKKDNGVLKFSADVLLPAKEVIARIGEYEFKLKKVGDFKWTGSWKIPSDLANGKYTVDITAADEEGNQGLASFELIVDSNYDKIDTYAQTEQRINTQAPPIDVEFEATPEDTFNSMAATLALIPLAGFIAISYRRKKQRK